MSVQPDPQTPTLADAIAVAMASHPSLRELYADVAAEYIGPGHLYGDPKMPYFEVGEAETVLAALQLDPSWSVERLRQVIARGLAVEAEHAMLRARHLGPGLTYSDGVADGNNACMRRLMAAGDEQS